MENYSPLTANITFASDSTHDSTFEPTFKATAVTVNSPLDVTIFDAPMQSRMNIDCSTSNSRANLRLPPAFEGKITTKTNPKATTVLIGPGDDNDPSGQGRRRILEHENHEPGLHTAHVLWVPNEQRDRSSATLTSWNANVALSLL